MPDVMLKPRPIKPTLSEISSDSPGPSAPRQLSHSAEESGPIAAAAFRPVFKPQIPVSLMSLGNLSNATDVLLRLKSSSVAQQSPAVSGVYAGPMTSLAGLWSGGGLVTMTTTNSAVRPSPSQMTSSAIPATCDVKFSVASSSIATSNIPATSQYVAANLMLRPASVSSFQLLVQPGSQLISSSPRPFNTPQLQYMVAFSETPGTPSNSKLLQMVPGVATSLPSGVATGFQLAAIPGAVQPLVMLGVAPSPQGQQFTGHPHPSIVPVVMATSNQQAAAAQLLK